MKFLFKLQKKC